MRGPLSGHLSNKGVSLRPRPGAAHHAARAHAVRPGALRDGAPRGGHPADPAHARRHAHVQLQHHALRAPARWWPRTATARCPSASRATGRPGRMLATRHRAAAPRWPPTPSPPTVATARARSLAGRSLDRLTASCAAPGFRDRRRPPSLPHRAVLLVGLVLLGSPAPGSTGAGRGPRSRPWTARSASGPARPRDRPPRRPRHPPPARVVALRRPARPGLRDRAGPALADGRHAAREPGRAGGRVRRGRAARGPRDAHARPDRAARDAGHC